jgi:hypothetical protein
MGDQDYAKNALKDKRLSKTANGFELTMNTIKSPIHKILPQNEDHSIPLVGVSNLQELFNMQQTPNKHFNDVSDYSAYG